MSPMGMKPEEAAEGVDDPAVSSNELSQSKN